MKKLNSFCCLVSLCFALVLCATEGAAQPSTPRDSTWITDGKVYAVAYLRGIAYIGGDFTFVGPNTWYGFGLNIATGEVDLRFLRSRVNGNIFAVAPDGSGGWYIGGDFTNVGGVTRNRMAHILSNGQLNATWDPNVNGTVRTIAVAGSVVYVGGDFTQIAGVQRNRIAGISTSSGQVAWYPTGGANGTVNTLQVASGIVYAGGAFTSIAGQTRNRIAALDAGTASVLAWNPNANNTVFSILASGSKIFVGGLFGNIGGQVRNYAAALDSATGNVLSWNPNPSATVRTITISGNTVYAGGDFLTIGGQVRNYAAAIDGTSGAVTAWNPNANARVTTICVSGSTVLVGGEFTTIGGQTRHRMAALNNTSGNALSATFHATSTVYTLAVSGTLVFAGGSFRSIGGQLRNRLAALDLVTTGATSWNPDADGRVLAIAIYGSTVYVGGGFTTIGGQTRNRLAALDPSTGTLKSWNPNANNGVRTIVGSGSLLYVGGWFSAIGGQTRGYIAALDTSTGFPTGWNPNANYDVLDIKPYGSTVFVAGFFGTIGGQTRYRLAQIDAATGLATSWNANVGSGLFNNVYAIDIRGSNLYLGGVFQNVGGQARNNLAAVDISTAQPTGWNPNSNGTVLSLKSSGDTIYVGGYFLNVGGYTRSLAASIHAITGIPTGWSPNLLRDYNFLDYGWVQSILPIRNFVLTGGDFTEASGNLQGYFAQFGNVPLNPVPTVTNISPPSGNRLQTLNVTLTGTGFIAGETTVDFGAGITVNSVTVSSSTQLTANITISSTAATGARNVSITNPPPGGGTVTFPFTVNNPAPTFASASPNNGNRLQTLTVTVVGSNFIGGVTTVNFGAGIRLNTLTVTSSTQLTANITISDTAATGARNVSITNPPPGGGTVTFPFTVNNPAPTFTSASPNSGNRLQTLNVTVSGSNFIGGVTTVNFGAGIRLNTLTVTSSTQLTANITISDTAATGARNVSITNPPPGGGTVTFPFTVNNPAPTLTRISPTSGERLQVLNVGFKGTNFISGVSTANVGAGITINSTTVHSPDSLTINITIGANATTGARSFSVTNSSPGGGTSGTQTFSINNPVPTLTSISPNTGNRLDTVNVTFRGTNFISGVSSVNVGTGITVVSATVSGDTSLTARIIITALADTGTRNFSITNPSPGGGTSQNQTFTVNNPAPSLTSISPNTGNRLQTLNVTITGSRFMPGVAINFGSGITINSVTVSSSTQIVANITISSTAATGLRYVYVTNPPPGGGRDSIGFTVNNPSPTLTSISPDSGARGQTLDVTFAGTNYIDGVSSVNVGAGITVNFVTVLSSTSLRANISISIGASPGNRNFSVTNAPPGGGISGNQVFRVNNPGPTLIMISPITGNRLDTLDVNFIGTNFFSGITSVNVGQGITVNATTVTSDTTLTANITITASAATGPRNFSVTNASPGGGTSGSQTFTVNNPAPILTSISPQNVSRGQTLNVVLRGNRFINGVSSPNFGEDITRNSFTVDSVTQITGNITVSPTAALGTRNVSVTNALPGGGTSGTVPLNVVNNAPTAPRLVSPTHGDTVQLRKPAVPINFTWRRSTDLDPLDTLNYTLTLWGANLDTSITEVSDTTLTLDIMERLQVVSNYWWTVRVTDGSVTVSSPDTFLFRTSNTITSADLFAEIPKEYRVFQNYPNPFNPSTTIRYELPKESRVLLKVYNILGQEVATLVDEVKQAGRYSVQWDAVNVASGLYFYRLSAGDFVETKKLMLIR